MATTRNRRGSVLLMAIGMLSIIAILASTFLIVSNLDVQESQTLSVKAQADPVAQGVLAEVMNAIAAGRHVDPTNGPYGITSGSLPGDYMDYPDDTVVRGLDRWLAREYDWKEKIGLQFSHVDTDTSDVNGYLVTSDTSPNFSMFTGVTTDSWASNSGINYVCTDGDKIPDARLYDTKVVCPGSSGAAPLDYFAAVRVVDLGARMCVNTAGGGINTGPGIIAITNTQYNKVMPISPRPSTIDLNSYIGSTSFTAIHDTGSSGLPGRCGTVASSNNYKSMRLYDRNVVQRLLLPANPAGTTAPGYTPFATGDEMFLMMCDAYVSGSAKYSGHLYDVLKGSGTLKSLHTSDEGYFYGSSGGIGEPTDEVRRHLTTCNSVSACIRHPKLTDSLDSGGSTQSTGGQYLRGLGLGTPGLITSAADCLPVYHRMNRMLTELNIGKAGSGETDPAKVRRKLAASFAANLWAYQANGRTGEPWAFTPNDDGTITAYGTRQDLVITQALALHRKTTQDTPNDDWAWGCAVEISNPSPYTATLSEYTLVVNSADGAETIPLTGTIAPLASPYATLQKKVIYSVNWGPSATDNNKAYTTFGAVATDVTNWIRDNSSPNKHWFLGSTAYVQLQHNGVTIDRVGVSADASELQYALASLNDIKTKAGAATAGTTQVNIRRDDRTAGSPASQRRARYNLALYQTFLTNGSLLGKACGVTDTGIVQGTYPAPTGTFVTYSAPIYRPRDLTVQATDPNAVKDPNTADLYRMTSLGEMANVYLAGPIKDTGLPAATQQVGFPQRIIRNDLSNVLKDLSTRGRLPIRPAGTTATSALVNDSYDGATLPPGTAAMPYPDVPAGAVFGEFFTRLFEHFARPSEAPRIYGQINVNTAAKDVLMRLPWPIVLNNKLGLAAKRNLPDFSVEDAVDYLLAYRDKRSVQRYQNPLSYPSPSYTTRGNTSAFLLSPITGLRASTAAPITDFRGFLTPGEVAIPLGDYMEYLLTTKDVPTGWSADNVRKDADFAQVRNGLYTAIADCITTRSDVFGVYIHVQLDNAMPARYKWRYLAVLDRSGVITTKDLPSVLMFTELK